MKIFIEYMKSGIKVALILLVLLVLMSLQVSAQLAGTNTVAGYGKNYISVNAIVTGTNGAASGGNMVIPTYYWNTTDGGTTNAAWTNSISPTQLPPMGKNTTNTLLIGGLKANTLYYTRVAFAQPDAGTNIIVWGGVSQSTTTALSSPNPALAIAGTGYTLGTMTVTNSKNNLTATAAALTVGSETLTITPLTTTFLDSNGVAVVCWTGATLNVSSVITSSSLTAVAAVTNVVGIGATATIPTLTP